MAPGKKGKRSGKARSGSGRGGKKGSGSGTGEFWLSLLQAVLLTFFGRVLLAMLAVAALVLANILISRDRFDVFYVLCAVEIIAFVAIGWLKLLLKPESD